MKKILFILLLIPILSIGHTNSDSLWGVWQDESIVDSARFEAISTLARSSIYSYPDSTFHYAQLQFEYATELGNEKELAAALHLQGLARTVQNKCSEAIEYYTRSITISNKLGNKPQEAKSLSNIGILYTMLGNYEKAIEYIERGLTLNRETNNQYEIAKSLINIGIVYTEKGELDSALNVFREAHNLFKEDGNENGKATTLANIGGIYIEKEEYQLALGYFKECMLVLGNNNHKQNNYVRAGVLKDIGEVHYKLGNIDLSIVYLDSSLTIAKEINQLAIMSTAADYLHLCYKVQGEHKKALAMLELFVTSNDSLEKNENENEVIRKEYEYEYEKKKQLDLKQQKIDKLKQQRQFYIFFSGGILLFILFFLFYRIRLLNLKREQNELLHKIELLKQKSLVKNIVDNLEEPKQLLDKTKIEDAIDAKLNETDWKILNTLLNNPMIDNKSLAEQVHLSYQGTSSSLRKMYKLFELKSSNNNKLNLVVKATDISSK
ncbi:MAG: hypothetical protein COB15_00850 [Flavobacteriales bacterium]|nr:MAG: hypothetical protein COB15_00850 [Flavobacteriales bacterium]